MAKKAMKGYIHVYTGNGKGKTTAALGLTLRAAGAGKRVFFGQFMKQGTYSEIKGMKQLNAAVTVQQFGRKRWVRTPIQPEDKEAAQNGLKRLREIFAGDEFDVVVMDEVNVALHNELISENDLAQLLSEKPERVELICTGRQAPAWLIERADLVTEMREIKHYFDQGLKARVGIER